MSDRAQAPITVSSTDRGIAVFGEIDAATAPAVVAAAELADRPELEIDMSAVEFVDSSGLRALIELHQRAEHESRSIRIVRPSPPVRRLLEISGVDSYLLVTD